MGPTKNEKRQMFADVLQRIFAVDFPEADDIPQTIYLLFHDEEYLKIAVFFLQDYRGTGFSLIVEKVDADRITLKIYELDTNDFHVCKRVPVKTDSFDKYKCGYSPDAFLSVGQLEIVNSQPKIHPIPSLKIPIKSISFLNPTE